MPTIHLVVNPAAGAGTAGLHAKDVAAILRRQNLDVVLTTTRDPDHAIALARSANPDDVVAPLGGDGMISLVTRGLLESGATLLPLPAGRGNDFVRSLGLPLDTAVVAGGLAHALAAREQHVRAVDVGFVNGTPFLGVVSVGFDAAANARANAFTRMRGPLVYTAAGTVAFAGTQRLSLTLEMPDGTKTVHAWNVAIGNSGRHGGGQRVCPNAQLSDGLLDIVTFSGNRAAFASAILAMRSGQHVRFSSVSQSHTQWVNIEAVGAENTHIPAYADGDFVANLPISVSVKSQALKVLCPAPCL